jgi:hypothetical protein
MRVIRTTLKLTDTSAFVPASRSALRVLTLAAVLEVFLPTIALGDRGAVTADLAGTVAVSRMRPPEGAGTDATKALPGAELRVRFALSHGFEFDVGGFWTAPSTVVNSGVGAGAASAGTAELRRELSRFGASAGVRVVLGGPVVRFPVGVQLGWMQTRASHQDLVSERVDALTGSVTYRPHSPSGNRRAPKSVSDGAFVAPFIGVEWLATDRLSFAIMPRVDIPFGRHSLGAVVIPVSVGWSWFAL